MNQIYCVKCRRFTETKDIKQKTTKNNCLMLQGICVVCGKKKSKFISASEKDISMTHSVFFYLKCTCRVTTSQDQAQS